MQFDRLLKEALMEKSESIEPSPEMWDKIKTVISKNKEENRIMNFLKNTVDRMFPWQQTWKRALAGALCGALFIGVMVFGFSPEARAWANDKVMSLISYKLVKTLNGYNLVKLKPGEKGDFNIIKLEKNEKGFTDPKTGSTINIKNIKATKHVQEFSTAVEAEKEAGFPIKLPSYLPDGYKLASIAADKGENGNAMASITYSTSDTSDTIREKFTLMLTNNSAFFEKSRKDYVKEIKINGKTAYWIDTPIFSINGKGSESSVKTGHMLQWKDGDVVYRLSDQGILPQEEMVKIAESIK